MSEKDSTIKSKAKSNLAKWGAIAAGLLVVFLLGLVPMLIQKWAVQEELAKTQTQLRKAEVKNLLTTSIVEAKRGEYEPARQNASNFFQKLRAEEEMADKGFLTKEERGKIKPVFDARDTVITMLAQRDQASVERLTDIYATYQQAMGVPQPPTTAPETTAPAETPASENSNQ